MLMNQFLSNLKFISRDVFNVEQIKSFIDSVRKRTVARLTKIDESSDAFDELIRKTKDRAKALDIYKSNIQKQLEFFLNSTLKNYLINESPYFKTEKVLHDSYPKWLKDKVQKDPLYLTNGNLISVALDDVKFLNELDLILDFIVIKFVSSPYFKLKGKSFQELLDMERQYTLELQSKSHTTLVEGNRL